MRRLAVTVLAACAAASALPAAQSAPPADVAALVRIASRLSGLPANRPVRVRTVPGRQLERIAARRLDAHYPRAQQAYDEEVYRALGMLAPGRALRPILHSLHVRGVQALYDSSTGTTYVRRGARSRAALLRELVHALQDRAFKLRGLKSLRAESRDFSLAARAAVDGAAALASVQATPRALSSHGGDRLKLFLQLEAAFPTTTGARFAATLHELGGRKALFAALRRLPETTEQIFHVDAFLSRDQAAPIALPTAAAGYTLEGDDSFGELDVRALLAVHQVPRLDHVGEGWGGGRSALYAAPDGRRALALVLSWDEPADAAEWEEAVVTFVNEAFDGDIPGQPARAGCGGDACWSFPGRAIAFARSGARTAVAFAPVLGDADRLARALVS